MPRATKSTSTSEQNRQAHRIEASAKRRGHASKRAAQIGYATVNQQDHGGEESEKSGRATTARRSAGRTGGRTGGRGSRSAPPRTGRGSHRA
jgi:hypothetical protein